MRKWKNWRRKILCFISCDISTSGVTSTHMPFPQHDKTKVVSFPIQWTIYHGEGVFLQLLDEYLTDSSFHKIWEGWAWKHTGRMSVASRWTSIYGKTTSNDVSKATSGAREMAPSSQGLPYKYWELSSDPQHPHERAESSGRCCNPSTSKTETGVGGWGSLGLAGQPAELIQWAPHSTLNLVSNNRVKSGWGRHPVATSDLYTHSYTHACAPVHTQVHTSAYSHSCTHRVNKGVSRRNAGLETDSPSSFTCCFLSSYA